MTNPRITSWLARKTRTEGVSTAKALALAMAQGERVYTLTQDNAYNLSQITIDSEARSEIQNAIQRGYEVTVHENPLNVNGWGGSGYAIIDPENGVGAYKISGGASGGQILSVLADILSYLANGDGVSDSFKRLISRTGVFGLANDFSRFSMSLAVIIAMRRQVRYFPS